VVSAQVWARQSTPPAHGIVALARKLLIALWHYVERGEIPEGAIVA
jgi:hypothetical protein